MDLSHPINSVTSPLTGRVFEVLAGTTQALSGGDISRLAGEGSRAGIWKALERLEGQGLVHADRRRSATYYCANREHLAWPAIEQLVGLRKVLRNRLAHEIDTWRVSPLHASMFGSAARGDSDAESDVDLLLVRPETLDDGDEAAWDAQLDGLRERVRLLTGNQAQTFALTPSRLLEHIRAEDLIVANWRRDGIVLAGPPLGSFIGTLRR